MKAQTFKQALAAGTTPQYGLFCSIASYHTVEAVAGAGFGFVILDGEHTPVDLPLVHTQLMAVASAANLGDPTAAIVRVHSNDAVAIKHVLDLGPDGLMIPMIDTAEQARAAVRHTRYPPAGTRGMAGLTRATNYSRDKAYAASAHERFCLVLQIETPLGLANIESICAVEGVDALFFGPSDYSANSGRLGQPTHPDVMNELEEGIRRVRRAGKAAGILCREADVPRFVAAGANLVAAGLDLAILVSGADGLASRLKNRG
jgi:4-hydroxy-2-oxoheptanedioate aldolase